MIGVAYQQQKDDLEAEARRREGKAWLVDDEVYEQRLADMGCLLYTSNWRSGSSPRANVNGRAGHVSQVYRIRPHGLSLIHI